MVTSVVVYTVEVVICCSLAEGVTGLAGALEVILAGQLVTSGPQEVTVTTSVEYWVFWTAGTAETAPAKMAAATIE